MQISVSINTVLLDWSLAHLPESCVCVTPSETVAETEDIRPFTEILTACPGRLAKICLNPSWGVAKMHPYLVRLVIFQASLPTKIHDLVLTKSIPQTYGQ